MKNKYLSKKHILHYQKTNYCLLVAAFLFVLALAYHVHQQVALYNLPTGIATITEFKKGAFEYQKHVCNPNRYHQCYDITIERPRYYVTLSYQQNGRTHSINEVFDGFTYNHLKLGGTLAINFPGGQLSFSVPSTKYIAMISFVLVLGLSVLFRWFLMPSCAHCTDNQAEKAGLFLQYQSSNNVSLLISLLSFLVVIILPFFETYLVLVTITTIAIPALACTAYFKLTGEEGDDYIMVVAATSLFLILLIMLQYSEFIEANSPGKISFLVVLSAIYFASLFKVKKW